MYRVNRYRLAIKRVFCEKLDFVTGFFAYIYMCVCMCVYVCVCVSLCVCVCVRACVLVIFFLTFYILKEHFFNWAPMFRFSNFTLKAKKVISYSMPYLKKRIQ